MSVISPALPVRPEPLAASPDPMLNQPDAAPATAFPGAANGVTGKIDEDYIESLRATAQETLADYLTLRNRTALETLASKAWLFIDADGLGSMPSGGTAPGGELTPAQAVTASYLDKLG